MIKPFPINASMVNIGTKWKKSGQKMKDLCSNHKLNFEPVAK